MKRFIWRVESILRLFFRHDNQEYAGKEVRQTDAIQHIAEPM